ncbi:MAG: tetratricopeptide repeat protein [Candidatus Contendobacter sp.]|nr:MAG: tetratricopeptide repeat protein [Candidatus Contendobacter sp.]
MNRDARDVAVSCNHRKALDLYETALMQYHSYVGDPIATIDQALAEAPDFVLGHAFRAGVLMMFGEQRFVLEARASVVAAENLAGQANDRECGLTRAARRLVEGDWDGACRVYDQVLVDEPRDAFAVQTAHLLDFYRGDALNLRNRISRVLPHWSAGVPHYSYILGMHAFGLEECNQYPQAEATGRKALELQPKDGWAVHAVVHVMEMQGRGDEGIDWLESRESDWAPDNGFAFHNWWHLALFNLDRQRHDRVLALYDRQIFPEPAEFSLQLVDATAMLWRLYLLGIDTGARFQAVADQWEKKLDIERGYYAFNDVHALLAFLGAGRASAVRQVLQDLETTARGTGGSNVMMAREVGLPLGRGFQAFARGRYQEAIDQIEPVRDTAHRFGGSHAQRDLLTLTLIEAAFRAGQPNLARHYLAERLVHKPASALGWRLLARTEGAKPVVPVAVRQAA